MIAGIGLRNTRKTGAVSGAPIGFGRKGNAAIAILLLALMAVLSGGAVLRESPTFDEYAHIGAGLSYVQKFDLRLNPEHPPLVKVLSGLSLAMSGARADYTGAAWQDSKDFIAAFLGQWSFGQWVISRWNDPAKVLFWARLPMLTLTLLLGWMLFVHGERLGGLWGGFLCLTVYVSAPIFLVFGPLVLTDIPIALFSVLTIWRFGGLWRSPDRRGVFLFSLSLAGAFLSKFSAPILLLGVLVSAVTMRWMTFDGGPATKAERKGWWRVRARATGKAVLWAALLVYAFYFVFSWNQPTDGLARLGESVPALMLRRILLPPAIYLQGMFLVLFTFSRSTYLFGREYPHGAWFYYPVVFALKSQLGFLGLLSLGSALGLARRLTKLRVAVIPADLRLHWRTIWVTFIVFATVCILSNFDISIRHFSVPAVLLVLMLAPVPRMVQEMRARRNLLFYATSAATAGLAVSCIFTTARAYPWFLPYVNALGEGKPAYMLMGDSNVDWGQALPQVKEFGERHQLTDMALDGYDFLDDTLFVPKSHAWDCQAPTAADADQWVVVSANMIADAASCTWLMQYEQEQLAGGSMYAFHLPAVIPAEGAAGGPPKQLDRKKFLGLPFDLKAFMLDISRHPERIPEALKAAQDAIGAPKK